jgi:hypothetical protein
MNSPEELFAFEVGLVDGHSRLNCCINLHEKSYRYYKSRRVLLNFDPVSRMKRWAFHRLKAHARPKEEHNEGPFLPGELFRGNLRVMPAFLQQLRSQKVESFIPLRLQTQRKTPGIGKLVPILERVLQGLKRACLLIMLAREERGKASERKDRRIDTTIPGATSRSAASTPPHRNSRSLSITYTKITLPSTDNSASSGPKYTAKSQGTDSKVASIRKV